MQYYPHLLTLCKASRRGQFLQMMIRVIQSTTSKQVILATHSTLVLNKPKIGDGFQPWSLNELALVLFKFGQFPKVASGDVTLINFDHDILQPKMMNQARTTPLTLTTPQMLNKSIMHQNLPLKMNQNLQLKNLHRFMALLIHDDRRGPESKELSMVVLWLIIKTPFVFVLLVRGSVVLFHLVLRTRDSNLSFACISFLAIVTSWTFA